jgi:GT2 family glycosyltransferase
LSDVSTNNVPQDGGTSDRICDVVIATRNRPEPLRQCLQALAHQSTRNFGIIVVDDHSDVPVDTVVADVVAACEFDVEPCVVRLPRQSGPAAARNAGVAASNARYVLFLDDDVVVDRHVVELHLRDVTTPGASGRPVVTRGVFVEPPGWEPTPWNFWEAQMATKSNNALVRGDYEITWRQFHTGNNCMPVDLFRAVGGFDESYKRMEDDEFGLRIWQHGCEFRFVPAALGYHNSNRSLESWLVIPRSYGYYTVVLDRQYPHIGYLSMRKDELHRGHVLVRLGRRLFAGPRRTRVAGAVAVGVARVAYRVRLTAVTVAALSLVFDLEFSQGLREGQAAHPSTTVGPDEPQPSSC